MSRVGDSMHLLQRMYRHNYSVQYSVQLHPNKHLPQQILNQIPCLFVVSFLFQTVFVVVVAVFLSCIFILILCRLFFLSSFFTLLLLLFTVHDYFPIVILSLAIISNIIMCHFFIWQTCVCVCWERGRAGWCFISFCCDYLFVANIEFYLLNWFIIY